MAVLYNLLQKIRRTFYVVLLMSVPLTSSCQMQEATDSKEFRLYAASVTDVFGRGALRDLARAAAAGKGEGITRAIAAGANPNAKGKEGLTPLMWAIFADNAKGVALLIKAGANPNQPTRANNNGFEWDEYPVVSAARTNKAAVLEALLKGGGSPESTSHHTTALRAAYNCFECVKLLVEHGADINRQWPAGSLKTVVPAAVVNGRFDIVIYLLKRGYNVDLAYLGWSVQNRAGMVYTDPETMEIISLIRAKGVEPLVPEWQKKK